MEPRRAPIGPPWSLFTIPMSAVWVLVDQHAGLIEVKRVLELVLPIETVVDASIKLVGLLWVVQATTQRLSMALML